MLNVLTKGVFIKVVGGTNPHTTHTRASKQLVRFRIAHHHLQLLSVPRDLNLQDKVPRAMRARDVVCVCVQKCV